MMKKKNLFSYPIMKMVCCFFSFFLFAVFSIQIIFMFGTHRKAKEEVVFGIELSITVATS